MSAVIDIKGTAITGRGSWLPSWPLIATKVLELRKRRALIIVTVLFTVGLPVIVLGFRELFHVADPKTYAPAGNPALFGTLGINLAEFGFIIAVVFGATAGTTDLTEGVFRHLVITGRSRLALFLARIPAGLCILLPLAAAGFTIMCLVTAFLGTQPTSIGEGNTYVPVNLSQSQLQAWIIQHPAQSGIAFGQLQPSAPAKPGTVIGPGQPQTPAAARSMAAHDITPIYSQYTQDEATQLNPSAGAMTDAGLWIELDLVVGFTVGLGLGSLMGQRTVPIILLVVLDIIITPPLSGSTLPYFINGQRMIIGVAMTQLQPQVLAGQSVIRHIVSHGGPGPNGGYLNPALVMPTWAMITVIVGWIVGWSAIGAWRMVTRDA